jgi:hypothetical protein
VPTGWPFGRDGEASPVIRSLGFTDFKRWPVPVREPLRGWRSGRARERAPACRGLPQPVTAFQPRGRLAAECRRPAQLPASWSASRTHPTPPSWIPATRTDLLGEAVPPDSAPAVRGREHPRCRATTARSRQRSARQPQVNWGTPADSTTHRQKARLSPGHGCSAARCASSPKVPSRQMGLRL